jgi:hypothetical protein
MLEIIRGLVRPFVAVSFVSATIALFIMKEIEAKEILGITLIVVGFYFGERAAKKGE